MTAHAETPNKAPLASPGGIFVGGQWTDSSDTNVIKVVNPATEVTYFQVPAATEADVARAVDAARTAFDTGPWPRMSHSDRAAFLNKFADAIERRTQHFGDIWSTQVGMLRAHSGGAVSGVPSIFRGYAAMADSYPFEEVHQPAEGAFGLLVREPVGVVGAIIPWNGPLPLIAFKVGSALLAGCTVVLKAAPEAPGEAYLMAEIAEEIGLPAGVLNVLAAGPEVSESLVRDARIDKISFTGSTAAGRRIASICGDRIARYTLELGGKSAAVILDDFDVSTAAQILAGNECVLAGQVCASITRIVIDRRRHDEMVEAIAATFSGIRLGDPFDPDVHMGPLAMSRQRDKVERLIETGRAEGATLAYGGGRPDYLDHGYFVEPTVFGNVSSTSTIAREEIFGPVLSVIPADNEDDAFRIANDSIYGLNSSVFTNDPDRALAGARRIRAGTVGHNGVRTDPGMGFGGFKQSGIGREGGREGLLPYLETKSIILDGIPAGYTEVKPNQ